MIARSLLLLLLSLPVIATAQPVGSHPYCDQLADIGRNTLNAKRDGHSLSEVLAIINRILSDSPNKDAAQGVVIAIYGDNSINTAGRAYDIVYGACRK